jgi:hypothetical protein
MEPQALRSEILRGGGDECGTDPDRVAIAVATGCKISKRVLSFF